MTAKDTITLPRELVEGALEALDSEHPDIQLRAAIALRTALAAEQPKPITVPKTVPLPPITCGFVDVRFDGERWFCDKCGKRMSADFETSVKRGSSEKRYLELMQRKAEALRTMNERNMK